MAAPRWAALAGALFAAPAAAQQVDMAAVMQWSNTRVVRYHVEGAYRAWTPVSHEDASSEGEVQDSLVVDVVWNRRARQPVGQVQLTNGPSNVLRTRHRFPPCPAPVLKGAYEHFDAAKAGGGDGQDRLRITGTRSFPAALVGTLCPASNEPQPSPSKQVATEIYLALPDPMMLAVPGAAAGGAKVSNDRRTFTLSVDGWTWIYTPTRVE